MLKSSRSFILCSKINARWTIPHVNMSRKTYTEIREIFGIRSCEFSVKEKQPMQHSIRDTAHIPTRPERLLTTAALLGMFKLTILNTTYSKRFRRDCSTQSTGNTYRNTQWCMLASRNNPITCYLFHSMYQSSRWDKNRSTIPACHDMSRHSCRDLHCTHPHLWRYKKIILWYKKSRRYNYKCRNVALRFLISCNLLIRDE